MPKDKKKTTKKPARTIHEQMVEDALELKSRATACETIVESVAAVLGVDLVGELTLETMPHDLALIMARLRSPQPQAQLAVPGGETRGEPFNQDDAAFGDPPQETVRACLESAARELGLASGNDIPLGQLAAEVNDEIIRIKGSYAGAARDGDGSTVETGDSLAQAIDHLRDERRKFEKNLIIQRLIVNRVAAVLNIQKWDSDGTEILAALNELNLTRNNYIGAFRFMKELASDLGCAVEAEAVTMCIEALRERAAARGA